MNIITPVAEFGYYLAFSLLVGHVVLQFVPAGKKPKVDFPKSVLLFSTLGIILFTFVPVLKVILFFKDDVGVTSAVLSVITSFQVGHVWLLITVFSIFLWLTIYLERAKYIQAFWIALMAFAVGYGSHVSSQTLVVGLLSHSTHFLMVTIWVGVLLHASWFSKDKENWTEFLQWFSPLAIICLLNIFTTGFVIMFTIEKPTEYFDGWATPYGRMLLFKHISVIPVIAFAIINGLLSRKVSSISSFEPRTWLKGESFLLLIVFFFTAVLGTLSPPHESVLVAASVSKPTWVDWLLANETSIPLQIEFAPTFLSLLIITVSLLFLMLIIFSFKLRNPVFALLFAGCFILTFYLGLMFSCVLYPII